MQDDAMSDSGDGEDMDDSDMDDDDGDELDRALAGESDSDKGDRDGNSDSEGSDGDDFTAPAADGGGTSIVSSMKMNCVVLTKHTSTDDKGDVGGSVFASAEEFSHILQQAARDGDGDVRILFPVVSFAVFANLHIPSGLLGTTSQAKASGSD